MNIINQYNLFLDTKYRNDGSNEFPQFSLKEPIKLSSDNNYFVAKIVSAEIPFSFKTLSAPYNTLQVRVQEPEHSIDITESITLTEGNYSIISLLDELKTKLTDFLKTIDDGHFNNHLSSIEHGYPICFHTQTVSKKIQNIQNIKLRSHQSPIKIWPKKSDPKVFKKKFSKKVFQKKLEKYFFKNLF